MAKKDFEDMDLISARKAAISWHDDAMAYKNDVELWKEDAHYQHSLYKQARSRYPLLILIGIMLGVLAVLIWAQVLTMVPHV